MRNFNLDICRNPVGFANRVYCWLTRRLAFGVWRLAFGVSYSSSSSSSKAVVSNKDWLNSGKAPSANCTCAIGLKMLVSFFFLFFPLTAFAHQRGGEAIGFSSGFEHPISGLDHILAMVAVGMWGAQLGAPAIWVLPVVFPMVMAFGGMMGLMGIKLPGIELCIALSAVALGFAVFREARPKLWIAAIIVGVFAIAHGHAHGTELPMGANGVLYSIGFVIATGLLHATGIGIGLIHRWSAGRITLRLAGAVVAMGGVFFLWKVFSGDAA